MSTGWYRAINPRHCESQRLKFRVVQTCGLFAFFRMRRATTVSSQSTQAVQAFRSMAGARIAEVCIDTILQPKPEG